MEKRIGSRTVRMRHSNLVYSLPEDCSIEYSHSYCIASFGLIGHVAAFGNGTECLGVMAITPA